MRVKERASKRKHSASGVLAVPQTEWTPIENVPQLKDCLPKLKSLGYSTFEQFIGATQVISAELEGFLGTPIDKLVESIPTLPQAISTDDQRLIDETSYAMGALIDEVPRSSNAFAVEPIEFTTGDCVDLTGEMPPIKNQGGRGTCVAFAATAVHEHYRIKVTANLQAGQSLSEQFLYWDCKRSDGHPTAAGTWLGVAFPALRKDGQCLDPTWQYVPTAVPGNEGQGPPPPAAVVEALRYRVPSFVALSPTSVADIKARLAQRRCVAFSIPVFNSWYANTYVKLSGDIVMPTPGEVRSGGHAMCIVGCQILPNNPELGLGRFILRNSWGTAWGIKSPHGPGYGTIPFAYIAKYGVEAYSLP